MIRHAIGHLPNEACGLLARFGHEPANGATAFYPIRNGNQSPTTFTLDPHDHIAAENDADSQGLEICGVMHSHPESEARPSPTDVAAITRFDPAGNWANVIVSLRDDEPEVRAFRIIDGEIIELTIEVGGDIGSAGPGR